VKTKNIFRHVFVLAFLVSSCGMPNDPQDQDPVSQIWVCHNPHSASHGQLCKQKIDTIRGKYETCYWVPDGTNYGRGNRNRSAFCWLLESEDCTGNLDFEWQTENCHLFENEN
jgi:hypothetical protein